MKKFKLFLTILAAVAAILAVYFFIYPIRLYESEMLPGFMIILVGVILSLLGPFQLRKESKVYLMIAWSNFLIFLFYIFSSTNLATIFFGP
ncbi:hypothetical protein [Paenibacillus sp. SN-8-1]|uniref:hypothetical protein n=1 Tax=Paenibacillus sp. SN-8-1 TaxID=3435409 RepID=UPI003D9A8423